MVAFLTSLGVGFFGEMGDKTQLLAFSLSVQYRKSYALLWGIFLATLVNHLIACFFGNWISNIFSTEWNNYIISGTFILCGLFMFRRQVLSAEDMKLKKRGAFLTGFILFFFAEFGDKTQIATLALAARYQSPVWVCVGSTLGMVVSDGIAIFFGERIAKRLSGPKVRVAIGISFIMIGIALAFRLFPI